VARVHTAARAVGLARAAVEDCIGYLQERRQFEHPIGDLRGHLGGEQLDHRRLALARLAEIEQVRHVLVERPRLLDPRGHGRELEPDGLEVAETGSSCTAATATPPSTRSSGTDATPGSPRSSRAPVRSR
jgi:hypothetical protein